MRKIKLRYMGEHQPPGIYEINEDRVEQLINGGQYILADETTIGGTISPKEDISENTDAFEKTEKKKKKK